MRKQNYLIQDEERGGGRRLKKKSVLFIRLFSKENYVNIVTETFKAAQEERSKWYIFKRK